MPVHGNHLRASRGSRRSPGTGATVVKVLIKWVTARVVDRAAFGRGQLAWAALGGWAGFVGQVGGWSVGGVDVAHVFGAWSDGSSYRAFMAGTHDGIAAAQVGTYEAIEVRLFEHRLDIGGELFTSRTAGSRAADAGRAAGTGRAGVIRLAHCHVRTGRRGHFVRAQAEVWNPAMSAAPGMLGGAFAQREETEFLVLSRWRSIDDHERYRAHDVAALRARAGAAADLATITGDLVGLEPAWTV